MPPNSKLIELHMSAKVQVVSQKKLVDLSSSRETISISNHMKDVFLRELYLRKVNKNYFLYALGRNGECTLNSEAGSA